MWGSAALGWSIRYFDCRKTDCRKSDCRKADEGGAGVSTQPETATKAAHSSVAGGWRPVIEGLEADFGGLAGLATRI